MKSVCCPGLGRHTFVFSLTTRIHVMDPNFSNYILCPLRLQYNNVNTGSGVWHRHQQLQKLPELAIIYENRLRKCFSLAKSLPPARGSLDELNYSRISLSCNFVNIGVVGRCNYTASEGTFSLFKRPGTSALLISLVIPLVSYWWRRPIVFNSPSFVSPAHSI